MKERKNKSHEKSKELYMLNYGKERLIIKMKGVQFLLDPLVDRRLNRLCFNTVSLLQFKFTELVCNNFE